jgi:CRP-like cAMP-binding protein
MLDQGESATLGIFSDPQVDAKLVTFGDGEVIYHPDTPADSVFCIQRGQVRLYMAGKDGSSRLMEILGPGEWFGAGALAGMDAQKFRAVAVGGAAVLEARVEKLLTTLMNQPAQLVEFNRQVAIKLINTAQEASRLVFEDCNQRLISALLRFSRSAASVQRDDGVVLRITHEQLAQAVGVARETVSLALTQLRQQNLLRTGRNQLTFNPETLREFSSRSGAVRPAVQNVG